MYRYIPGSGLGQVGVGRDSTVRSRAALPLADGPPKYLSALEPLLPDISVLTVITARSFPATKSPPIGNGTCFPGKPARFCLRGRLPDYRMLYFYVFLIIDYHMLRRFALCTIIPFQQLAYKLTIRAIYFWEKVQFYVLFGSVTIFREEATTTTFS